MQTVGLADCDLDTDGAKAIADYLHVSGSLKALDLSSNKLCGLDTTGQGTYTTEGIAAIANALRVNTTLTDLVLYYNGIGDEGAKALADALRVNASLTRLDLRHNGIASGAASQLLAATNKADVLL